MKVSFTPVSKNPKTGPIPNTITEMASCPRTCPHYGTCYASSGPLAGAWEAVANNGYHPARPNHLRITTRSWDELCEEVSWLSRGQVWRHNTAGDLPGEDAVIDTQKLNQLVQANKKAGALGFTFTHKIVGYTGQYLRNAQAIYAANKQGFRINLSADSLTEADELADMGIAPVVVAVPVDAPLKGIRTPKGRKVITCPAEYKRTATVNGKTKSIPIITCKDCKICTKERQVIVAFHAHGVKRNETSNILRRLEEIDKKPFRLPVLNA